MVVIEQGALLGIAGSHVEAYQPIILEPVQHLRVVQHLVLKHFATDAPVGVPVQQQRLASRLGLGQGAVELRRSADGLPLRCGLSGTRDGRLRRR